ncbi:translation initiation factor 1 [Paracidovorax citrulli]
MALSSEWEEVHLTPSGWVDGSYKHDNSNGVSEVPVPADAVLSVRRKVYVASTFSKPDISEEETVRSSNESLIAELKAKFGKPVFGV